MKTAIFSPQRPHGRCYWVMLCIAAFFWTISSGAQADAAKLEYPNRVVLSYPVDGIEFALDLTGFYQVSRFEIAVRSKRFLIPDDACEKFGVRIEHLHVIRQTGDGGSTYFQVTLFGNQTIGEGRSRVGDVPFEIVPTCEIAFDSNGFRGSKMGTWAASILSPLRDPSRRRSAD
jgi:hypothetical protein